MDHDEFRHLSEHQKLDEIHRLLCVLVLGDRIIMSTQAQIDAAIAQLNASVAQESTVEQSAIALLNGIGKRVDDAVAAFQAANPGVDVSQLSAVSAQIAVNKDALAAAVVANTPAASAAPAPPANPSVAPANSGTAPAVNPSITPAPATTTPELTPDSTPTT